MQLGVVLPEREIGTDPIAVRDYAQAAEELGYDFLVTADHVLGANRERYPDLLGPYGHRAAIHEPLVLFGFLAAVTTRPTADHERPDPAPAADRAGGEAGRRRSTCSRGAG